MVPSTSQLRPATEPCEDRNDAGEKHTTSRPAGRLRPATEPGEDRNSKHYGQCAARPTRLRPATEPGEDRNSWSHRHANLVQPTLRPATEPGEDRNSYRSAIWTRVRAGAAPGHRAGRGSQP